VTGLCKTYKHWGTGRYDEGDCTRITSIPEWDDDEPAHIRCEEYLIRLTTRADFGCVLHEEL
jgi:hypothetical protein